MAQRRKVIPVTLTQEQREKLERLWFVYGNHGPQMTNGNHSFIQGLLERGQDERPLKQRGYIPTAECERAVDKVLSGDQEPEEEDFAAERLRRFRLISGPGAPDPVKLSPEPDPVKLSPEKDGELKGLIKSLQEVGDRGDAKTDAEGEMPPAA